MTKLRPRPESKPARVRVGPWRAGGPADVYPDLSHFCVRGLVGRTELLECSIASCKFFAVIKKYILTKTFKTNLRLFFLLKEFYE